jgi:hypothetical protein
MKHTFASSSRHPAPCRLLFIILDNWAANEGTCKNVCNVERFRAKGNTFLVLAISFCQDFFVLKAASFPNTGYFHVLDACNSS